MAPPSSIRAALDNTLASLSDEQLRYLHDFAVFLCWRDDREEWLEMGKFALARCYAENEPDYTEGNVKS